MARRRRVADREAAAVEARDVGLAAERTDLSWGRTLLAVMTVSSLFLKWLPIVGIVTAVPLAAGILTALTLARLRYRRRDEVVHGHGSAAEEVCALTALVLLVGLAALAVVLRAGSGPG
jgi:uncharacterized membrane protein YidH (DUF202 family)